MPGSRVDNNDISILWLYYTASKSQLGWLNLLHYYITWSIIQQRVYETRGHNIDELQQRLLYMWCSLEQSLIDDAVDQCPTPFACLCSGQRRTFWTYMYFVTINLLSMYLVNFMFHTVLHAAGDVLRVHYKSSGGGMGRRGYPPQAALWRGRHLEGRKYGILKFGRSLSASGKLLFVLQTVIFYTP